MVELTYEKGDIPMRRDAEYIYKKAIRESLPDSAVRKAISEITLPKGRLILVAIGKAAWKMAECAYSILGDRIDSGAVITKHAHSMGAIGRLEIYEAGHPVPDECGIRATRRALEITSSLSCDDLVLFLVSGGGSALFEDVSCPLSELEALTAALLGSGASIQEINTVRKHLSNVKGGRFAEHCAPARVHSVILSDVIGSPVDVIASGPTVADSTTVEDAIGVLTKYSVSVPNSVRELIMRETPKSAENSTYTVSGSVSELVRSAARAAEELGYETHILSDTLDCEAREAGAFLGSIARLHKDSEHALAFIVGGETVVHLIGDGKGGRNQELALSAARYITGLSGVAVFSVGSDGTDGPTDAAGGYVDGDTEEKINASGGALSEYLYNNDAYRALSLSDGLIITGPTGTNVNDFSAILIKPSFKEQKV